MKNIARLLAMTEREHLQYIRVRDGTLSCTDGHLLIRRRCEAPSGLYWVQETGSLAPVSFKRVGTLDKEFYPDIDLLRPREPRILSRIPKMKLQEILQFLRRNQDARSDLAQLIMKGDRLEFAENPNDCVWHDFGPHFHACPVRLGTKYCEIMCRELLNYDEVKICRDPSTPERPVMPLIWGLNWGSCCMLMPRV